MTLAISVTLSEDVFDARESGVGFGGVDFAEFHGLIEVGADFSLGLAQGIRQKIFENGAITAESGSVRDAATHDTGADDGNGADFGHSLPADSRCWTTLS